MAHTIQLDDADYEKLARGAAGAGLSVSAFLKQLLSKVTGSTEEAQSEPSRWAQLSERVRQDPPLSGTSGLVQAHGRAFRDEFALTSDDYEES
jgi:hypothetical protein